MPTLYVRNVPVRVYTALRQRAARNGRSVNAEVLVALQETLAQEQDGEGVVRRIEAFARKHRLPADAPRPEELLRNDRDHGP